MKLASVHDPVENIDIWMVRIGDTVYMHKGTLAGAIVQALWKHALESVVCNSDDLCNALTFMAIIFATSLTGIIIFEFIRFTRSVQ